LLQHIDSQQQEIKGTIAVWNLETGLPVQTIATCVGFGFLAWAGPDHLCLCNKAATQVFDVPRGVHAFSYQGNIGGPRRNFGLARTPDGRIWRFDPETIRRNEAAAGRGEPGDVQLWKATTATGPRTEQEAPFFAEDRTIVDLKRTPLRLDIDAGKTEWSQAHGEKILAELQRRGYTIGPAGFVLRVQPRIIPTTETLTYGPGKSVSVPRVEYVWQLLDAQDESGWLGRNSGHFLEENSKYHKGRQTSGTTVEDLYDFGRQTAEEAIVREILERGVGFVVPNELPAQLLRAGGKYVEFPRELPWTFVEGNPPANN
jgi:hypothetical protein